MRNVTLNEILCFWVKFTDDKACEQIVHLVWLFLICTCAMNIQIVYFIPILNTNY